MRAAHRSLIASAILGIGSWSFLSEVATLNLVGFAVRVLLGIIVQATSKSHHVLTIPILGHAARRSLIASAILAIRDQMAASAVRAQSVHSSPLLGPRLARNAQQTPCRQRAAPSSLIARAILAIRDQMVASAVRAQSARSSPLLGPRLARNVPQTPCRQRAAPSS